ncbi:TetR family transcriptional regulator [Pantoea ananatis LMG 5342]|uniref:TetR/AcrR family transcriptional regulator n=1 Tax=Pantoea ananas TaxID=553 RepID=UPI000241894F|nr:TetR/AcrR family transcriptional regulator [Pantoea ananatis]CCF10087.1 TetR family transcriptional regulator [Pantoea ananatis LMG 5342]
MSKPDNETFFKQRQQLIISAAKNCFSRSGFHGTSMADISRESGLGAGQLYRYFNSKEVIVSETIKSIAENWRTFLLHSLAHETHTANIIDTDSPFWQNWSPEDRCLLLEMYSEASRHESVRSMLAREEALLVADLDRLFRQKMPTESPLQRSNRIQFLLMLVDGVACHAYGDKNVDQQELSRINAVLDRHLF